MDIYKRAEGFVKLGEGISSYLKGEKENSHLDLAIKQSYLQNGWFTEENVLFALDSVSEILSRRSIDDFLHHYDLQSISGNVKSVGKLFKTGYLWLCKDCRKKQKRRGR